MPHAEKSGQNNAPSRRKSDHALTSIDKPCLPADDMRSRDMHKRRFSLDVLHTQRVLLVDDIKINIIIIKNLLESKGWQIDVADNGADAVAMYQNAPHDYYDLILTDVIMPVMDGLEEARQIRSLARIDAQFVPIIAVTSVTGTLFLRAILNAGMNARVLKP